MKAIQQLASLILTLVFAIHFVGCKNGYQVQTQPAASTPSAGDITQRMIERRAVETVI